jgi:lysophospholipase L1-like esterase
MMKRNTGYLDIFQPHPVLGWSLTPNQRREVLFRGDVLENIGADGWRVVAGASAKARWKIAFYGCSFTFGCSLRDEETFTSILQSMLPDVQVLNRGVGGYGTTQSYLQFRKDARERSVDAAIFCVLSDHRYRNYGHPNWMRRHLSMRWHQIGVEHMPRARLDRSGKIWFEFIPIWQPSLLHENFQFVFPDEYTLDNLMIALLREIREMAAAQDIPTALVLLDSVDESFAGIMQKQFPDLLDVSTPYNTDHTFLPHDIHPNGRANEIFAQKLYPRVRSILSDLQSR